MQDKVIIEEELDVIKADIINALMAGKEIDLLLDHKYKLLNKKYKSNKIKNI